MLVFDKNSSLQIQMSPSHLAPLYCISMWTQHTHLARCFFIYCMFLSGYISLWKKAESGKVVNVPHLLQPGCWLTSSPLSGSQLKLCQKWTGTIYWSKNLYAVNQEMMARFLPSCNFPWTVSEMTGRDRGERLANDLLDRKVMNSVVCENTFLLLRTSVMV